MHQWNDFLVCRLADAVVDSLEADGLLDRQYGRVKLHATLMNSVFATTEEEGGERQTFNAKPILEVGLCLYCNNFLRYLLPSMFASFPEIQAVRVRHATG